MKVLVLVTLAALTAAAIAAPFDDTLLEEWETFKTTHNKMYDNEEENYKRMEIFIEKRIMVARHNERFAKGEVSYALEVNHLADLTDDEYDSMNGFKQSSRIEDVLLSSEQRPIQSSTFIPASNVVLPAKVDWREKGAVTPVKDQGHCASDYAFSAMGALEGQHFLKTKDVSSVVSLSEQNILDCSGKYGNVGCEGGDIGLSFKYVWANKGVDTEKFYPYEAKNGSCRYNSSFIGATVTGLLEMPAGNETALQQAVAKIGPISAMILANKKFQLYKTGVFYDPDCNKVQETNHFVLIVGYGTDKNGTDYWLVKNSWGEKWGEKGYIRMARNRNNNCWIGFYAMYPFV